jgi:CheY-like chemotaxis protein
MISWPYCFYPTTAIFVDDQTSFLNALKHRLSSKLSMDCFNNPTEALNVIQNSNVTLSQDLQPLFSIDDKILELETDVIQQTYIGLHLDILSNTIYNSQRFATKSVVIVDQMMPELDGISFCKKIKEYPIKKIMLTSNSDQSIAVNAFNEGLIDQFLLKDSPNLEAQLLQKIQTMQRSYFELRAEYTVGGLTKAVPLISDSSAIAFYEQIKEELQAVEFYLLDRWGSMLFLDQHGTPTTLVVCSTQNLDVLSQVAEDQDEHAISESLMRREKLVFFPKKLDYMRPVTEWRSFLHSVKQFPDQQDLFYALITDPLHQPVNINNIRSYQSYLSM